jgi:protein O-GlcNAc transferase
VQVSYLGYQTTAGLSAIDYRVTDEYLSPPDQASEGPETLVRLPGCYWCYTAPAAAPEVSDPPAVGRGQITFASLNNFAKVNSAVIELWARLLHAAPNSRLSIIVKGGQRNQHVWRAFEQHGIARGRIELLESRSYEAYWQLHREVDIALDPTPYCGGVTTLDALWMGVAVVTLAGERISARGGTTILSNLDLPDLIAQTPEQYVRIACDLAADLPRLTKLRRTLRERMRRSPLMDGPRFARGVETAYRQMWREWVSR